MEAGLQATKAKMELHAVETEAKLEATQAALNSLMQSTSQQNTTAGKGFVCTNFAHTVELMTVQRDQRQSLF